MNRFQRTCCVWMVLPMLACQAMAGEVEHTTGEVHGWPVERLRNGLVHVAATPNIGGRVLVFESLATGHNALKIRRENIRKQVDDAWEGAEYGGLSDAATTGWPGPFWPVTYQASVADSPAGKALELLGRSEGLEIRRTMTLAPDSTLLKIAIEQRNVSQAAKQTNTRLHAELAIGDKADNHDAVFWVGPEGLEQHDVLVGAEHRRYRWIDVMGDWIALVDTAEGEAIVRRFGPEEGKKRVFYWIGYNEAPEVNGDRGGFVGLDWFGESKVLQPGEAIEAVEEMFLVTGLTRVDFVSGYLAGGLMLDHDRFGRSDTVAMTVGLAGATATDAHAVKVHVSAAGAPEETLATLTGATAAASAGKAGLVELGWTYENLPDGTYRLELAVLGGGGKTIGRAAREIQIDGDLVGGARQAVVAFGEQVDALAASLPADVPLDVATEWKVLQLRRDQLAHNLAAGKYETALQTLTTAKAELAALRERLAD